MVENRRFNLSNPLAVKLQDTAVTKFELSNQKTGKATQNLQNRVVRGT